MITSRRMAAGTLLALLAACSMSVAPARAADSGVLFITSNPPGVEVALDGRSVGKTPIAVEGVSAGEHTVTLVSEVYEDVEQVVNVPAEDAASVSLTLRRATSDFTLSCDIVGATVIVDASTVGTVEAGRDVTVPGLEAGPHSLALKCPFFKMERSFGIKKGADTHISVDAASWVGGISATTTIPAAGMRVNGHLVAEGPGPYAVGNLAPGSYLVEVLTEPYPYRERVEVQLAGVARIDLDASRDVGKVIITSVIDDRPEIRIDDRLVEIPASMAGSAPPLVVPNVVKGAHIVEVFGSPDGAELLPDEELLYIGRTEIWVPAGGVATANLSADRIDTAYGKACPDGMVRIPAGRTEGEFWFNDWEAIGHPGNQPQEGLQDLALQGKDFSVDAAGVPLTLTSVSATSPTAYAGRSDLTSSPISDHTSYFTASVVTDFCIDIYEYPNRAGAKPRLMGYFDASAECERQGKRLCNSAEWVKACSGPEKQLYPYGDAYKPARCNTSDNPRSRGLAGAGAYADCVNGYGLYDMSGNAAEWTVADFTYDLAALSSADDQMLATPSLIYTPAVKALTFSEVSDSPKLDYRGGDWMSTGWDASCRAMPPVPGNYVGSDSTPSAVEQLVAVWPSLDPVAELPIAHDMLSDYMRTWNATAWRQSAERALTAGIIRGLGGTSPAAARALEDVADDILKRLGKSGAASAILGASSAPTVTRGSGPESRYLGSARLRGFRCCSFAHGEQVRRQSASAGSAPGAAGSGGSMMPGGPAGVFQHGGAQGSGAGSLMQ